MPVVSGMAGAGIFGVRVAEFAVLSVQVEWAGRGFLLLVGDACEVGCPFKLVPDEKIRVGRAVWTGADGTRPGSAGAFISLACESTGSEVFRGHAIGAVLGAGWLKSKLAEILSTGMELWVWPVLEVCDTGWPCSLFGVEFAGVIGVGQGRGDARA